MLLDSLHQTVYNAGRYWTVICAVVAVALLVLKLL